MGGASPGSSVSFLAPHLPPGPSQALLSREKLESRGERGSGRHPLPRPKQAITKSTPRPAPQQRLPRPLAHPANLPAPTPRAEADGHGPPRVPLQAGCDSSTLSPVSASPPQHLGVPGPDPGPSGGQTEVSRPTQFSRSHFKTLASPCRLGIQQTVLVLRDKG